jgi:hypothetical protein
LGTASQLKVAPVEVTLTTVGFVGTAKKVGAGGGVGFRASFTWDAAVGNTGSGVFSVEQLAKKMPLDKNKIRVDFFIRGRLNGFER